MPEKWSRSVESQRKEIKSSKSSKSVFTGLLDNKQDRNSVKENDTLDDINFDGSMSKSIEEALFYQPICKLAAKPNGTNNNLNNIEIDESSILKLPTGDNNISSTSTNEADDSSILPTTKKSKVSIPSVDLLNTDSPFKGISLREFETQRKLIEEQNKQKKELLHKAIELQ